MFKKIFITGLAAIIPIGITIYVIVGVFSFADGILGKIINRFLERQIGFRIPGLGILLSILIIFIVGLIIGLTRMRFYRFIESLFFKIPWVKKIYFPVKQIVDFLFFPSQKKFIAVVLVEYPRKGLYFIGFVTKEDVKLPNAQFSKKMYSVFLPSTPSPLTGFTIFVSQEDIIFLDMSVEDAIKLIISGGLLSPYENTSS
ncbi:MAG: DUF502 domain-containing protein [Candidatus Omnitrophica bacterium]|nr:DUF502 domain-containing protein [Candidatus Omnitrophota bacterium]MCM8831250.1 DUF502 domain-containing protein [Candidatus Omnitrophota bacterium]